MADNATLNPDDEMRQLCKMVLTTQFDDLPEAVVGHTKQSILDTLAVTMGGSSMEGVSAFVDLVKDKGGKAESYLPFHGGKVPASEAALAIGPMSRAMDFGDLHMVAGHVNEYILPALLGATGLKSKVSGKDFITALLVGAEVLVRIGLFVKPGISMTRGREGGHYIFGCVAAIGKLIGLNQEELENAQGIASAMTQPHSLLMYNPTTLMIRGHHGFICQAAINACQLAQRGITGPRDGVLSSPAGYSGFLQWDTDISVVTKNLGKEWQVLNIRRKRYPIAGSALTVVDGIIHQMEDFDFTANEIASLHLVLDPKLEGRVMDPKAQKAQWRPESVHDCQFSVPYGVATAAYDQDVFLDSYTDEARSRKDVRDLMTRISVSADEKLPPYAARVVSTLKNGEKYTSEYLYPKGHPDYPLSNQDLIEKFEKCARYSAFEVPTSVTDSVSQCILDLEKVNDVVKRIIKPLTPQ
jgi:2-methylcitrate dehydratase PrpD